MRCYCCNRNLSDEEATNRHPATMEFLDMCSKCLKDIPIEPLRSPLFKEEEISFPDPEEDEYKWEEDGY